MEAAGNGNLLILRCFLFLALWKKVHVLKGNLYAVASYKTLILPPPNPFAWEGFVLLPGSCCVSGLETMLGHRGKRADTMSTISG